MTDDYWNSPEVQKAFLEFAGCLQFSRDDAYSWRLCAHRKVFTFVMGWLHVDVSRSRMWMWLFQPRLGLFHWKSTEHFLSKSMTMFGIPFFCLWEAFFVSQNKEHGNVSKHSQPMTRTRRIQTFPGAVLVVHNRNLQKISACKSDEKLKVIHSRTGRPAPWPPLQFSFSTGVSH